MQNSNRIPVRDNEITSRLVADHTGKTETVLVMPVQGKVKVLNEVASRIWSIIDSKHSVEEIINIICEEYDINPEQAEKDVVLFLGELESMGAITL